MDLVQGSPTEVKVVLASVATALATYQLMLISIVYRKVRLPFLAAEPAAFTHRANGDTLAFLLLVVAIMCLSYFGLQDGASHAVAGFLLLVAAIIVAVTIVAVTAQLTATSAAELEAQEERLERQEERRGGRQDR